MLLAFESSPRKEYFQFPWKSTHATHWKFFCLSDTHSLNDILRLNEYLNLIWSTGLCIRVGFPGGAIGKEPTCQCRRPKRPGFNPWVKKIPWRREWLPTSVFLPGESHGQRSLVGYTPEGRKESDTLKRLSTHASGWQRGLRSSYCFIGRCYAQWGDTWCYDKSVCALCFLEFHNPDHIHVWQDKWALLVTCKVTIDERD